MSSLGDIQQMHAMLQEMDRILARVNTGLTDAELQAKKTLDSWHDLKSVAADYLLLVKKLGFDPRFDQMMTQIAMLTVAINQLMKTMTIAATVSGPIGWLTLGAAGGYTALSFYSIGVR